MKSDNHKAFVQRCAVVMLTLLALTAFRLTPTMAFTCHREVRGPLTFEIAKTEPITVEGQIYRTPLTIKNKSDKAITVKCRFSSIDSVYLYDESGAQPQEIAAPQTLERECVVEPNSTLESDVAFAVRGAYTDAHYPIRALFEYTIDGKDEVVDLRPVFATSLKELLPETRTMQLLTFDGRSYLRLNGIQGQSYVPYWMQGKNGYNVLPVSWSGVEPASRGSLNPTAITRSGIQRSAWSIHPPYNGGPGVIGARFAVKLPKARKLELRFFSAMRDVFAPEPPTDGVEFRVYAAHILTAGDGSVSSDALTSAVQRAPAAQELLYAKQYAGTDWLENNVDLTKFAGETVLLTLEADPGVKHDTTCDNSFWGDVVLLADPQEAPLATADEREELRAQNLDAFKAFVESSPESVPSSGVQLDSNARGFDLDFGQYAVVTTGKHGVCDGWITIGSKDKFTQIAGVRVQYQGTTIGVDRPFEPCEVSTCYVDGQSLEAQARIFAKAHGEELIGKAPVDTNFEEIESATIIPSTKNELCCFIGKTLGGLAFRVVASHNTEIASLQFGTFTEKADRVYFGHGYCIDKPSKAFQKSGDGFACSTSHIGLDFTNGLSLLEATTRPVDELIVDPELQIYTLTTTCDSRLTLRSSDAGAMDCAMKYAPGFDKEPALLVPKKAGRFVFDFWGGSYANILELMKLYVRYGLTDSMLIQHSWQHYGYDVRLPDVWPPNPAQGTLEELKATQDFLDQHDVPFGLHDNYIDFYPDADGFTYDDIIFEADGQPQKAWYNPGPDAQSYRFNPTKFFPYAERNLNIIREELMQTAYFTDVFSSIHIMNFFDREGKFHSRAETLDWWNKYFELVHERFNNNAITVSESGSDALIGSLDGADAILRRITSVQESYSDVLPSADNEFVPWFDVVNHKRFILHGAGYSDRFQAGESRGVRGIESDDYISSEVLTGHAIMSDLGMTPRGTVRKYWLLQNLARSLALDDIVGFEFVGGNIHRQKIVWKSGVVVYVNRGVEDWTLDANIPGTEQPIVLPRFGYWTADNNSYGGIVRVNNQVTELRVDGKESFFVNGRQVVSEQVVPIRPTFEDVEILDSNSLSGTLVWDAIESTDKPYAPFLHLERPQTWWNDKPELMVLWLPEPIKPSSEWKGREDRLFGESTTIELPEDIRPGFYNLLVGLYDRDGSGRRLPLLGSSTKDGRYRLGGILVEGEGEDRKISFTPCPSLLGADLRLIPNRKSTDFGVCQTIGAFRYEQTAANTVVLTPLPDEPAFEAALATSFFADGEFEVVARDAEGAEVSRQQLRSVDGTTTLTLDAGSAFSYAITKR